MRGTQIRLSDSMEGFGRATHDCMDAGGRVKQESEPRMPMPGELIRDILSWLTFQAIMRNIMSKTLSLRFCEKQAAPAR